MTSLIFHTYLLQYERNKAKTNFNPKAKRNCGMSGKVLHVPYLPKQNIADTSPEVKQKIWFFD